MIDIDNQNDRQLFGGAMKCSVPRSYQDVSAFRQVPDNQEVFADTKSAASIIIELIDTSSVPEEFTFALQRSDSTTLNTNDPALIHFQVLAEDNQCTPENATVLHQSQLESNCLISAEGDTCARVAVGLQRIQKFNQTRLDQVLIMLCVFRLQQHTTDIVLSMNLPLAEDSQASKACQLNWDQAINGSESMRDDDEVSRAVQTFVRLIKSFQLVDSSIFGS
ncbi:hypothetical protein MP228_006932 [Amoeboaphelidium protococcarum]|nr:hypothetical protein MP228_006932 [Amoeboaphelidium protococcarum]